MAVSNVGGGGSSRDPSSETRRKQLEQQRANELDRIEMRFKDDIKYNEEARAAQITKIREAQAQEIAQTQKEADTKINLAERAAEDQLKRFNSDTQRITDEASRRFHQKAALLAAAERELDHQRKHIEMQNRESLQKLSSDNTNVQMAARAKAARESEQVAASFDARLEQMRKHGNASIANLENDIEIRKNKALTEGDISLSHVKHNQERLKEEITEHMAKQKASGDQALTHLRTENQSKYQYEYDKSLKEFDEFKRMSDKRLRDAMYRSEKELAETRDFYGTQIRDTEKVGQAKIADVKTRTEANMYQLTANDRDAKHRAELMTAKLRKDQQDRMDAQLALGEQNIKTTKEKIDADFIVQSKALRDKKTQVVDSIIKEMNDSVSHNTKLGEQRLATVKEASAQGLNQHSSKATDPFYRLQNIRASVTEGETGVHIVMAVPEHEQLGVRVVPQGNGLTISGSRRYEDRTTTTEGRLITTNSYQSYSETVPLKSKVDVSNMKREYANGILSIFIPRA